MKLSSAWYDSVEKYVKQIICTADNLQFIWAILWFGAIKRKIYKAIQIVMTSACAISESL